jgi:hypothetical protein
MHRVVHQVKLEAESVTRPERLIEASSASNSARSKLKTLAVPAIDVSGQPGRSRPRASDGSDNIRPPRGPPDAAQPARRRWQHLRAGKSQKRPLPGRHGNPSPGNEIIRIVRTHRAAKMTAPAWP